ncbi:hypothetical protein AB0F93_03665 [Micromonospora tulbaghiae]|uniref:hypothetical protein n=1 Tax=Micromonospora tulbaghiae TaxID=479978 RepID=UPI003333CA93
MEDSTMIRRFLGIAVVGFLIFGAISYVSNNPKEAGNNGAHIVNEGVDTGAGLIKGLSEFLGALGS